MSKEEKEYNVNCPKGYGKIKFLIIGDKPFCPVSELSSCLNCDVRTKGEMLRSKDGKIRKEEE
jgi:hypothetical protein